MTRRDVRWIVRLWRPFAGWLALIVAVTFIATLARVSMPIALKRAFDGFAGGMTQSGLLVVVLLYLGLGTLEWALATLLVFLRGTMNFRFESAAREQAYGHLVHHAPGFFQRFRTGDLVTRLTDDVSEKLSWFICSGIFRAIAAAGTIVFAIVMMLRLDPLLTVLTVGPLPILVLLFIQTGTVLERRFDEVQTRISDLNGAIEACFSGIRVVKAYGREDAEERTFARFADACRRAEIAAAKSTTILDSLYGHVWQLGVVVVLLAGGTAVIGGRLTLGTFVAFDAYVLMLIFPMLDVGTFFVRGRQSAVSIGRLRELEETRPEIVEREGPSALATEAAAVSRAIPSSGTPSTQASPVSRMSGTAARSLRFEGVSYSYARAERGRAALQDVSFELAPGRTLAVVGKVGSGKSTLLRLVPRIVDPSAGRIVLDGANLVDLPLTAVRQTVGYVPQEAILFSGTIRDNIRFSREWIDDASVVDAARAARLEKDLAGFADGVDALVGARGIALSGGQKQRVALARALAGRPRILVLDDATAALDAETEAALWSELQRSFSQLALILVTHRTATLERADRILVLEEGSVVEEGTHSELAVKGAVYRSIYRRHALAEKVGKEDASGAGFIGGEIPETA